MSWSAAQGHRRWFVVHQNDKGGEELRNRAVEATLRYGGGGEIVGAASAIQRQPFYGPHFDAALNAGADAIITLLSDVDQIVFVAQQQNVEIGIPTLLFPHPNTQTRDYIAAARASAPTTNPEHRFALWDAMLEEPGAADFNTRYLTRWGDPADPTAWSAYHAVKILYEATRAVGSTNGGAIVDYLENSGREFELLKGPGTSFRPWDHQLRQPLYIVRVDQDAVWDRNLPTTRAAIAGAVGTLPVIEDGASPVQVLDQFGDGGGALSCR
jgi:branched-chain amino acid transport system substrate-binding protein